MMTSSPTKFLVTAQYRRFAEICNKSQSSKFIALFFGKTGLGKTECAMHYSNWRTIEPLLEKSAALRSVPPSIIHSAAAVYTPDVSATPTRVQSGIRLLRNRFDELVEQATTWHGFDDGEFTPHKFLKLLIVDEADRLKPPALEVIRDLYDHSNLSILLIGSPGVERRLRRSGYGQLHARFSIAYEIQPLKTAEMQQFIAQKWSDLKLPLKADDAVSAAIMGISGGNFRALHRIFIELERLQKVNCLPIITPEVVETARRDLLLGVT